jgi:hypothetical protein
MNMDYVLCQALAQCCGLLYILVLYDIMCQYLPYTKLAFLVESLRTLGGLPQDSVRNLAGLQQD